MALLPARPLFNQRNFGHRHSEIAVRLCGILSIPFPLPGPFLLQQLATNSPFCFACLSKCCQPAVWCPDAHWQLPTPFRVEADARPVALGNPKYQWDWNPPTVGGSTNVLQFLDKDHEIVPQRRSLAGNTTADAPPCPPARCWQKGQPP